MFESICIRPNFEAPPLAQLDLGLLAESMLFYQRVDVVLNRLAVHQLIRAIGPQTLVEAAESGLVTFSYWNQTDAVFHRKGKATGQNFVLGMAEFQYPIEQEVASAIEGLVGRSRKAQRLADRLLLQVSPVTLDHESVHKCATDDALSGEYASDVFRAAIEFLAPKYRIPASLLCDVRPLGEDGVTVRTNIDWKRASRLREVGGGPITVPSILSLLVITQLDLELASRFGGDLITNPLSERIIRLKSEQLFERAAAADGVRREFQEFLLEDANAVREAVNSGARSFADVLSVAQKTRSFRSWLSTVEPDANVIREYWRKSREKSWLDAVPAKTARWLLVTGGGALIGAAVGGPVGTIAGPVLGTGDFLQDAVRAGWKPNQFAEGHLQEFASLPTTSRRSGPALARRDVPLDETWLVLPGAEGPITQEQMDEYQTVLREIWDLLNRVNGMFPEKYGGARSSANPVGKTIARGRAALVSRGRGENEPDVQVAADGLRTALELLMRGLLIVHRRAIAGVNNTTGTSNVEATRRVLRRANPDYWPQPVLEERIADRGIQLRAPVVSYLAEGDWPEAYGFVTRLVDVVDPCQGTADAEGTRQKLFDLGWQIRNLVTHHKIELNDEYLLVAGAFRVSSRLVDLQVRLTRSVPTVP